MTQTDPSLPLQPAPDPDSQGFWEASARGELALCRCTDCGLWLQPPLERCRSCAGATRFERVSGRGRLFSFIVVRYPCCPGYLEDLPYQIGLVELEEQSGLRLPARILSAAPGELRVGQRLRAEIVPLPGGDFRIPVFRTDAEPLCR